MCTTIFPDGPLLKVFQYQSTKMKCFKSILFFLICFSITMFLEVTIGALGRGAVTTFERQFQVDTKRAASPTIVFQICNLASLLVASYLGKKYSRPRLMAIGCLMMALGYFLASMPHFLAKNYNYKLIEVGENETKKVDELCRVNSSASPAAQCHVVGSRDTGNQSIVTRMFWMMILGYVLAGSGSSGIFPLGFSYVDDYAAKHKSAAYIAFANAMMIGGNAAGYALSGGMLKLWVDFERVNTDEIDITNEDPRWIGAWWLGYPIGAVLLLICSIVLFFFPRSMAVEEETEMEDNGKIYPTADEKSALNREAHETEKREDLAITRHEVKQNLGGCKGLLKTCKNLLLSPVYVCAIMSGLCAAASQVSVILFSPKYLEVSFGVSASKASFILGIAVLPCTALGIGISGFIMRRWELERKGALRLMLFGMTCSGICVLALLGTGCQTIDISGVTDISYTKQTLDDMAFPETTKCNKVCGCATGSYSPVCGDDDVTYLSACHAGCTESMEGAPELDQPSVIYSNCSCVNSNVTRGAVSGRCLDSNCPHVLVAVVVLKALSLFFGSLIPTPSMITVFRSVPKEEKSIGVGVSAFLVRGIGFIPSQIILASIIDTTCLYWSAGQCEKGFCKIYDNNMFRHRMYGVLIVYQILSILGVSIGCIYEWREREKKKFGWCS